MKNYISFIYLLILWISSINTIINHYTNLTVISTEHYFGILTLLICTAVYFYKRKWINIFLLIVLTTSLFNVIQFIPDPTTIQSRTDIQSSVGNASIKTIKINLYALLLLILYILFFSKSIYRTIKDVFSENQYERRANKVKINASVKDKANKLKTRELEDILKSDIKYTKEYRDIISEILNERKNNL